MNTKGGVPDAWDDDWISKADVSITTALHVYIDLQVSITSRRVHKKAARVQLKFPRQSGEQSRPSLTGSCGKKRKL